LPTKRDLRWRFDLTEMRLYVVGNHRIRLAHRGLQRLRGSSPHERRQRLAFGHDLPAFDGRLEKRIRLGPAAMQR
jgi:hypothetical protein